MSTTVQYKGNTLTTVSNATKTLKTAGKYMEGDVSITDSSGSEQGTVWQDAEGYLHLDDESSILLQTKTATPSESAQTIQPDAGYYALDKVNVSAISSTYVGSGIARKSSSDLTVSGATVTAPAGYYSSSVSKSVATMTLPTSASSSTTSGYTKKATIGRSTSTQYINIAPGYNSTGGYYEISAVANGSASAPTSISGSTATVSTGTNTLTLTKTVSVTPVVSAGYVSSGTATNSSVSLTASVTVNPTPTASGATVTIPAGYYSAQTSKSVASGTAGTPTASKGTVTNHSVSVTPSVTNTTGYITGGTKNGTAVTVSASELVSGTLSITGNKTGINVTNYASVDVSVSKYTATCSGVGHESNCSVKFGNTVYFGNTSFGFNSGQTILITAKNSSSGAGKINVDGVTVVSGTDITDYSYTLPDCDIAISFTTSNPAIVNITTKIPEFIAQKKVAIIGSTSQTGNAEIYAGSGDEVFSAGKKYFLAEGREITVKSVDSDGGTKFYYNGEIVQTIGSSTQRYVFSAPDKDLLFTCSDSGGFVAEIRIQELE